MDPVVHFEMAFKNRDRMAKFYQSVFSWKTEKLGEEMGHYVLATTTETGKHGPKKPGAINGGFYPQEKGLEQHPTVVISVKDIKKSMKKIKDAGGKVLEKPMDIPGIGKYVSFKDTEGNRVTMLEPVPMD